MLLAEVALRLIFGGPARWAQPLLLEREDKRVGLDVYPDNPRGYFDVDLTDPEVRSEWRDRGVSRVDEVATTTPYAVAFEYNEQLCRHGEVGPKDSSTPRIVFIGDSFTEGQGVRQQDTFAAQLDQQLDGRAEVINCGRRGHDFPMIHEFFTQRLDLEPDLVVYAMILNDPVQSEEFHARQAFLNDWILDRRRMYTDGDLPQRSFFDPRLLALFTEFLEERRVGRETTQWYLEMFDEPNREGWEATQDHIEQMRSEMTDRGGELLVVLLPLLVSLEGDYPFALLSETISDALESRGVPFHDTTPALFGQSSSDLWVHPADRHPNEVGHRLIADNVRPVIEAMLGQVGR